MLSTVTCFWRIYESVRVKTKGKLVNWQWEKSQSPLYSKFTHSWIKGIHKLIYCISKCNINRSTHWCMLDKREHNSTVHQKKSLMKNSDSPHKHTVSCAGKPCVAVRPLLSFRAPHSVTKGQLVLPSLWKHECRIAAHVPLSRCLTPHMCSDRFTSTLLYLSII